MQEEFDPDKFSKDREVDDTRLLQELGTSASLIGYYGQQKTIWKNILDSLKLQKSIKEAQLFLDFRRSDTKFTEKDATAAVKIHPDVIELEQGILSATCQKELFENAHTTLEKKSSNCQSMVKQKQIEGSFTNYTGVDYGKYAIGGTIRNDSSATVSISGNEKRREEIMQLLHQRREEKK